jgi:PKD repeat protein
MRKLLLFALMLSGLMTSAQTSITNGNCRAAFKYAVNDSVMTLVPATAINFYDRSEGKVMLWFWDFGDGNTSNEQNPMFVFNHPLAGSTVKMSPYRTVNLTVLTEDSCKSFYSEVINIMDGSIYTQPACKARFKYYQTAYDSIGRTASFQLTNLSEGDSLKYSWLFDNGKTSTEKEPTVTFDFSRPDRKVCLTVTGANNCNDMFCDAVYVTDPNIPVIDPVACETAFAYSVNYDVKTFAPALVLDFHSKAWPEPTEWNWDFGDGTTSNEANPTHTFNLPIVQDSLHGYPNPFRNVCLTVKTATGCMASKCETINIYNVAPDNEYKMRIESGFPMEMSSCAGWAKAQVYLRDSIVKADNYVWSTGDVGQEVNHLCPMQTYSVKATTPDGNVVSGTFVLSAYRKDSLMCDTGFGYSVNHNIKTLLPALALDFYSKASPDAVEWTWDFGDGSPISNEANPTHIFNLPLANDSLIGTQSPFRKVCLTVKTSTGCVTSSCQSINIYMETTPIDPVQQCHAWFKYYKATDVVTIPEVVAYQLKDVSEGKVIRRVWQFENGDTSTVAAPLVTFDIFKATQKVCLTIYTADSCMSTWCETIQVSNIAPDTTYVTKPTNTYAMRYEASFPPQMSSCAGWAKAQVYMNDSLVNATDYVWSNGAIGQEVKGLCPTQLYTVKAITPDGTYVTGTFVFNSDGTVTDAPFNWWVTGVKDNPFVKCDLDNRAFSVEWRLCDGTLVKSDSIPLNSINCGGNASNMILKDASGNVIYSENITLKTLATGIHPDLVAPSVKLFPNPVTDVLNIQYSGTRLNEMQLEICDLAGRRISLQKFYDVESGQQISLNVNSLPKGIYLCKMLSDKQIIRIEKFSK